MNFCLFDDNLIVHLGFSLILSFFILIPETAWTITHGEAAKVRAAFVYNFLKYTRWSKEALEKDPEKLRLCIRTSESERKYLEELEGRQIHNREIQIKYLPENIVECHAFYISDGDLSEAEASQLAYHPVVTITNSTNTGIIRMFVQKNKIRFKIYTSQAEKAGIRFEANLMRVAREVVH